MKNNKVKDHRALLAMTWTIATFAIIFVGMFLVYHGLTSIEEIVAIITPILPLDAIILNDYFHAKEKEKVTEGI